MNEQRTKKEHDECNDAALRSCRTSREPIRALHGGVQESADAEKSTVGRAVEKRLRPVPGCVEANGEPEIAGAPDGQAEKQGGRNNLQNTECVFSVIEYMGGAEHEREKHRSRPEAPPSGDNKEQVAPKGKLFGEGYGKECDSPAESIPENCSSRESHGVNLKMTRHAKNQQDRGKHREAPDGTFPKSFSKCLAGRGAVIVERAFLQAGHNPSRQKDKKSRKGFDRQFALEGEHGSTSTERQMQQENEWHRKNERDSDVDKQPVMIGAALGLRLP